MEEIQLKNQIIAWLRGQSYWFQYAGNRLLEGESISNELVDIAYQLFKEDYGLKPIESRRDPIVFSELTTKAAAEVSQLKLQVIKEIKNVNALATEQSINISPNLTIIYGGNGTGKSGYIRLLNNAFNSRGDKNILPNVFKRESTGKPSCKFTFQSTSTPYDLEYPLQKTNPEFAQFSVLDAYSIRVHLEHDNKLNFTPSGFEYFDKILKLYEGSKERLFYEIKANRPVNDFSKFFVNENEIKNKIKGLGADSNEAEINALATYTEEDATELASLIAKKEALKALNIPKRIDELQRLQRQLSDLIDRLSPMLHCLKPESIYNCKTLIDSFHTFQELARQEGIISLEGYNIDKLGSNEWRGFIRASREYASAIETSSVVLQ